MIRALAWALRQHPDTITPHEKLILIGLADMSDDEQIVRVSSIKLSKFTGLDSDAVTEAISNLSAKGFIKCLDDNLDTEFMQSYKLIVTR
jgi:DNA-binding MarR family transcriptional regulator